jgi:hypothetical protein
MVDEGQKTNILDILPKEVRETTITEMVGTIVVTRVDPEKVFKLIKALQSNGLTYINYAGGMRQLDPELARELAKSASDVLKYSVDGLINQDVPIVTAGNWGSSILGLVIPKSDIDIKIDLPTTTNLRKAGQILRLNDNFRNGIWRLPNMVKIPKIDYSLSVPSLYKEQPEEKWIPSAHDMVKIPHP